MLLVEAQSPPRRPAPLGRIVVGLLVIGVGVAWLLEITGAADVAWGAVLPACLMLVGAALILGSGRGTHGGLIATGIVMTGVLALTSGLDLPLEGGIGDRIHRPATAAETAPEYRLLVGSLKLDLSDVRVPETGLRVGARVGMGQLLIDLPDGVAVEVRGRARAGEVVLLGKVQNGVDVEHKVVEGSGRRVHIDASVGLGSVKVER